MYTIRKQFSFSAAHQLFGLAENHPCGRLHGHNYVIEVVLAGKLNKHGFVRDYRELDGLKHEIDNYIDHRDLNRFFGFQTTAENLAQYFYVWCKQRWPEVSCVRVSETPKTWAEYTE